MTVNPGNLITAEWESGVKRIGKIWSISVQLGYYFERELEKTLDVPVGIIGCNWGGTRSCAWMSAESAERVGKPWVQMIEQRISGINMEEYWKKQHGNPMNHRK